MVSQELEMLNMLPLLKNKSLNFTELSITKMLFLILLHNTWVLNIKGFKSGITLLECKHMFSVLLKTPHAQTQSVILDLVLQTIT